MFKKIRCILSSLLCSLLLASCGFHLRTQDALAPALRTLHLQSNKINYVMETQLKNQLKALGVHLVAKASQARVTLAISNYQFNQNQPSITTSNQALSSTIRLRFTYQLLDNKGRAITQPDTISAINHQVLNANQIYQHSEDNLVERRLQTSAISILYDKLISDQVTSALTQKHLLRRT